LTLISVKWKYDLLSHTKRVLLRKYQLMQPTYIDGCLSFCLFLGSLCCLSLHILCFVFVLFSSSCVPYVASLSRLHFCDFCFRSSPTSCVPYAASLSRLHFCYFRLFILLSFSWVIMLSVLFRFTDAHPPLVFSNIS
jgi:hypothetical protein